MHWIRPTPSNCVDLILGLQTLVLAVLTIYGIPPSFLYYLRDKPVPLDCFENKLLLIYGNRVKKLQQVTSLFFGRPKIFTQVDLNWKKRHVQNNFQVRDAIFTLFLSVSNCSDKKEIAKGREIHLIPKRVKISVHVWPKKYLYMNIPVKMRYS